MRQYFEQESRIDYSREKPLTRDEFVELGHAMMDIANKEFGVKCGARVTCYTRDYLPAPNMAWFMGRPRAELELHQLNYVRLKVPSVDALRPQDMQAPGRIEMVIRPLDIRDDNYHQEFSQASLSTVTGRTSITANIEAPRLSPLHFLPVYEVWNEQARRELPRWQQPFHLARTVMNMYKAMKPYAQP